LAGRFAKFEYDDDHVDQEEREAQSVYGDPAYRKARLAFLSNVKVFASAEPRVQATALAFVNGSLETQSNTVIANDSVNEFLDDLNDVAKMAIAHAKADIKALLNSETNYFENYFEKEQRGKKTEKA